jgi:formylglycine-generating enzyme required for sulfatase activity
VIAIELHERGGEHWSDTEALAAMNKAWRRAPDIFADVERQWRTSDRPGGPTDLARDLSESAGLFGKLDDDGRWRFRHRTLKEYLIAAELLRAGEAAQDTFFTAWEAEEAAEAEEAEKVEVAEVAEKPAVRDASRSGEIVALLTALQPSRTERLAALAQRAPDALVRLLTTTEGLDPDVVLDLLFSIQKEDAWDEDQLVTALLSANGSVDDLCTALWRRVKPGCDPRTCCLLYGALARIPAGGDLRATLTIPAFRERFFNQLGIPLPNPKRLRVDRVPRGTPHAPPAPGPVVIRAVELDGGTFHMGSPEGVGADDEHPAHRVTVGPFALGQTLVTRAVWALFESARSTADGTRRDARSGISTSDAQLPAVDGTWWDAALFAAWLGARLPTEAEWEYACRAGTSTRWSHGDEEAKLSRFAHLGGDSVQPVATKRPNPWGLYDVHGNAWEWCADGRRDYVETAADTPLGPRSGSRVFRGGSFLYPADWCRSAYRNWNGPRVVWDGQGLRVLFPPPARDL